MQYHFALKVINNCSSLYSIHSLPLPALNSYRFIQKRAQTRPQNVAQSGFTLIEIVISISIIGILAAVAIPSYLNFTKNQDVSSALAALMNATAQMEKEFIDRGSYKCSTINVASKNYTFDCSLTNGYTLTATSDDNKNIYTINKSGTKATTKYDGSTPSNASNCWKTSDNGCY